MKTPKIVFALAPLSEQIRLSALDLSGGKAEAALVGARLMDGLRDCRVPLPAAEDWREKSGALVVDEWARVEILVRLLRSAEFGPAVSASLLANPARILTAFPEFVSATAPLLTTDLLLKSPFRVEEFARKWIHELGGSIEGETEDESRDRMERLDFGGVLKNLKAAETDREVRMKKLKQLEAKRLKEEQDAYARAGRE